MTRGSQVLDYDTSTAWVGWAMGRGLVRLADGREGRLIYYAQGGGKHKVLIAGRYERVPYDSLVAAIGALEVPDV